MSRTIPDIGDLLDPVEKAIRHKLLPTLTGRSVVSDLERELFSLLVHLGGLNIANPSKNAASQHNASTQISAPLTALIIQQSSSYAHSMKKEQEWEKQQIKNDHRIERENRTATLYRQLPEQMQRAMNCASEKGASSWLSTLPIAEHGFALHKGCTMFALCMVPRISAHKMCVWQTVHSRSRFKLSLWWSSVIAPQQHQRCYSRPQ